MTGQEWTKEFQIVYGRDPQPQEFINAKNLGFPSPMSAKGDVHPGTSFKVLPQSTTIQLNQPWMLVLKVALVFLVAVFGFIVGYLFA